MANFCSECGAPLNGGNFCSECGAKAETQTEKVIPDNSGAEAPQPEKACADNSQPEAAQPERIIHADSRPEIDFERGYSIYGKNLVGLTSWVALNYKIPRSEAKQLCSDFLETKKDEKAPNLFKRASNQVNDEIQKGASSINRAMQKASMPSANQTVSGGKRIYEKTWFIILLIIFFFPVGLFLMWKYTRWNKTIKIIVTILVVLMAIFALVSDNSENTDTGTSDTTASIRAEETSTQPVRTVSESVQLLMDEGLTEEEANAIMNDLNSVGIEELVSLKKGSGEGVDKLQAYAFSSESVSGVLTIENRKTYYIGTGNLDLFNASEGGKLDDVTRYLLSESEKYMFMADAESYVKQGLKSPSTADFPSHVFSGDWKVTRKDDVVTVSSYVDAQNGFGAMIRSNFIVQISYSSSDCLYLEIDGQVLYGEYH